MRPRRSASAVLPVDAPCPGRRKGCAFTLTEVVIVIAILALLISVLAPSLGMANTLAKIARAHAELRGITLAVDLYRQESSQRIPPTRFSCASRTAYELPVELLPYLPGGRANNLNVVRMPDPFTPEESYRYRAVGPAIMNESTLVENASTLWVPDGLPGGEAEAGRYYNDPATSPVLYAVWSMGPDPAAAKFDIPGRLPVPGKYWLRHAADTGVIVHFEDAHRRIHTSP